MSENVITLQIAESTQVTCGQCAKFIHPGDGYERNSMGFCRPFEEWLDSFHLRRPKPKDYDRNYLINCGKVFFTDVERYCGRFKEKV
jgi:hypothetical protein